MYNSGDAAEQIVRISLEGTEVALKLTGSAAKNIAAMIYAVLKNRDKNKTKGRQRLTAMLKSGKELKVFTVGEEHLKQFATEAKRYGVVYCALRGKEKSADGMVDIICIYRWLIRPPEKWQINSDSMQISASSLRNFLPKKIAVCGARFFMAFTPRTDKLFPLLSRRLAMWAVSRIGVGMALTAVWNGAPVLFRGRRMSAGILIVVLSRNLQAAQTACNGLRIEVNGLTTAPRRRRV